MSTVGRATAQRWGAVVAGVAVLVAAPVAAPEAARTIASELHPHEQLAPQEIVQRALGSVDVAHEGVAQARGTLGLPDLPRLSGVPALLGGATRMRVWWSSEQSWRVDTLTLNGEVGTYGTGSTTTVWDFERSDLTTVLGADGVRLPRADDLLPPQAARRVLSWVGADDLVEALPDRWVAGRVAAGVRLVPGDPRSTVAHVDLWVDPDSGLPLELRVVNANGLDALVSRFLDVHIGAPAAAVLVAPSPIGARREFMSTPDLAAAVDARSPWRLPDTLAGLPASRSALEGTATYGVGLVRFAVLPLPPDLAHDILHSASDAGALELELSLGAGSLVTSSILNAVVVRAVDDQHAYVLAGLVTAETLERAAQELLADPPPRRSA